MAKLGFIGFGKMAEALWGGFQQEGTHLFCESHSERTEEIQSKYPLQSRSLPDLVKESDIILVCIKPQQVPSLLSQLEQSQNTSPTPLWVSICAGTQVATYEHVLGDNTPIVRVMPNTPILIQEGMSALYFNKACTQQHQTTIQELFKPTGRTLTLNNETLIDSVTGISGSGPAFCYQIALAVSEAGQRNGLTKKESLTLMAQTMIGAGTLLLEGNQTPESLIADVSSPNGTTVAGLDQFQRTTISQDLQSVIQASIDRAKALSK